MEKERKREKEKARKLLMRQVQKALPNVKSGKIHDIKTCHRSCIGNLTIDETAKIKGLRTCKSAWSCLYCTPLYLLDRKKELEKLLNWTQQNNYRVCMITETHRHTAKQRLDYLSQQHLKALKELHNCRRWRDIIKIGLISGRDYNYSEKAGWHFHSHEILILSKDEEQRLKEKEKELKKTWILCCEKNGLKASERNGLNFQYDFQTLDYLCKFDFIPNQPPEKENYSPFYLIDHNINKFLEYVYGTVGVQRISWSKNLRKLTKIEREEKVRAKKNKIKKQARALTLPPQLVSKNFYEHLDEVKEYVKTNGLDAFERIIKIAMKNKKNRLLLIAPPQAPSFIKY